MSRTILCADCDPDRVQILARALGERGYRVLAAHDGEQALALAREEAPDLAMLDALLPGCDGFSLLERLRHEGPPLADLPVVLLSGAAVSAQDQARAACLGAAALLTQPVPLGALLSLLDRHLKSDAAGGAPVSRAAELAGSLDRLPFASLLHHLHGLRASGVLHLESGKKRKWIEMCDGYPVAVRSNLVDECLGRTLLRSGCIDQKTLDESLRRMKKKKGQLQGELLVAMEVLSEDELALALREQAEQKVFEIFAWRAGSFRFEFQGRLQRSNALGVDRSPADLILHGALRELPDETVRSWLGLRGDEYPAPSENPFYRFQEIELDPAREAWLRGLDGSRTLRELVGSSDELGRTFYALVVSGMVELHGSPLNPPSEPPSAGPAWEAAAAAEAELAPEALARRAEFVALEAAFRDQGPAEMLGVADDASDAEVRTAFETLARRVHPDTTVGLGRTLERLANDLFSRVTEAYADLREERRQRAAAAPPEPAAAPAEAPAPAAGPETPRIARPKTNLRPRTTQPRNPDGTPVERRRRPRKKGDREAFEAEGAFQAGLDALRSKSYDAALEHFAAAARLKPEEWEYLAHHGYTLHLCDPKDEATAKKARILVSRAVKLAGEHETPYLFMGRLCLASDRPDAAEKMFARALSIQPNCIEAQRELRILGMRMRKQKGLLSRLMGR